MIIKSVKLKLFVNLIGPAQRGFVIAVGYSWSLLPWYIREIIIVIVQILHLGLKPRFFVLLQTNFAQAVLFLEFCFETVQPILQSSDLLQVEVENAVQILDVG